MGNDKKKIEFIPHWGGNTLYHPNDLPFDCMAKIPDTFTQFKKIMETRAIVRKPVESLTEKACKPHPKFDERGDLSSLKQLNCLEDDVKTDERTQFPFEGGETSALNRLNFYIWGDKYNRSRSALTTYKKTRNESIGTNYSTKFSPFLAHGNISARSIYHMIKDFEQERKIKNESTYWVYVE